MASTGNSNLVVRKLDLSSMTTVRQFAREIRDSESRLDILILNAGLGLTKKYTTEEDDLEVVMASNHFGHFLLANLLAPLMISTASTAASRNGVNGQKSPSRIVVVSSVMHKFANLDVDNLNSEKYFDAPNIYANTKLCNVLMTFELARRLKGRNVTANALHPGVVQTGFFRNYGIFGTFAKFFTGACFKSPKVS